MTYKQRLFYLMGIDSVIVFMSIYFSNFILIPRTFSITFPLLMSSIALLSGHHYFAHRYRLYNRAWEYASIGELLAIFKAVTFSILFTAIIQFIVNQDIYFRTLIITWMIHMLLIGGSRFSWRFFRDTYLVKKVEKKRAVIIGAGQAGTLLARQLKSNMETQVYPIAFLDDDPKMQGLDILGAPVVGPISQLKTVVQKVKADYIFIAIPSLTKSEMKRIVESCTGTKAKVQIMPRLEDIMLGKVSITHFRDVQIEDLLGREPVELDMDNISEYITGQTVLVTGAGGSIGSEICRQISEFSPKSIILLGHGENSIYSIELELKNKYTFIEYITEIADVQDKDKMMQIMSKHRPNVVYHAAAHKHVPLMERNPEEAIKNNVIGTKNVAEAADQAGVKTFVMVSTDKAVNPTSVMGATKRIAEMIVQHMDSISNTRFVAVRFGNVLGSRGSVIPLFKKQIRKGGPVTVTHPDMTRYFMTIPEASRLVIQAGALAKGGEIFVLDMGDPVKIVDLAKNLIRLSGYTEEEIGIEYSGIRPGEKLFEELLNENEVHKEQVYPKIHRGKATNVDFAILEELIGSFREMDADAIRKEVLDIVNHRKAVKELAVV